MVFQPIRAYNRDAGHIKWVALSTICNVCLCVGLHTALSLSASTGPLCVTSCMGSQCFSLFWYEKDSIVGVLGHLQPWCR